MKALEKAAKDRGDASGEPPPPTSPALPAAPPRATSELTLEPVVAPAPVPESAAVARTPAPPLREKIAAPPLATPATARESVQAAAMIRAAGQHEPSGNVVTYLRDRPLMTFGTLAVLFLVGFGGYVYLQMNPGLFVAQTARPAPGTPIAPIAQAPVSASATPPQSGAAAAASAAPLPLTSLLPPAREQIGAKEKPPGVPPSAPTAPAPAAVQAPVVAAIASPAAARDTIKVTAGNITPTVNPVLTEAYNALAAGNLDASQRLYNQLLKSDARNIEALLGLAAIASQQGDRDTSTRNYIKVIELDPRNSLAQAGLIGMVGAADPQSAETRVKQLIARDPGSAYLYFTLGNTYVDQRRWPDAQQAFFQAHHLQPDNPDYAYNLAIALEHIGQTRSALDFYRRAVLLAAAKGHANFNTAAVQERVNNLEKVVR